MASESQFLAAWKDAVKLSGVILFDIRAVSVDAATDKNDLRPDWNAIEAYMTSEPYNNHYFLIAVLQFFSYSGIEDICNSVELSVPRLPDLASLDNDQRDIIYRLIETYDGW